MTESSRWTIDSGNWKFEDGKIIQTTAEGGAFRIHTDLGISDFTLETSFRIDSVPAGQYGEAKIIFSDADKSEDYRIDFIGGVGLCRVTVGGVSLPLALLQIIRGTEYRVKVRVKRNFLSVKVNDMDVIRALQFGKLSSGKIGLGTYQAAASYTEPRVTLFIPKKCFVIMQFDELRDFLYESVIVPTLENHLLFDFEYARADKLLTAGKITEEIDERLRIADLVIADITGNNPNVFYELGLAHAYSRRAILLIQRVKQQSLDIPFDIKHFRVHGYEFSTSGFESLKARLPEIVSNVINRQE